ncbi:MAG: hypothetical protein ACD_63C00091G0007 [uncultured bacterium]|nr:MAG: hypothetical protein ACD_63C00091G0007 [uncultured bacterium]
MKKTVTTKMRKGAETKKKTDNAKAKAANLAVEQIKERFGDGAIMKLGDAKRVDIEAISTGSISLDIALGVGGVPRGRVVEIFGPESSGKTTLAQHVVAEVQKIGGSAAYIDAEHALDPSYAAELGVKVDDLFISQPDTGEQALEIVETLVRSNAIDLIVIDSVAALTPRAEIEGEMGDSHMGLQARLMSQALRKLTATISKTNTTVIFINQIRMKIGVLFGNPETTPGGKALKFYSSVRIEIRRRASMKKGDREIGMRAKIKVVKNKVAPPFQNTEVDLLYGEGFSKESDIIETGLKYKVLGKSGSWISYEGKKIAQGREKGINYLKDNPKVAKEIEKKIWQTERSGVSKEEVKA